MANPVDLRGSLLREPWLRTDRMIELLGPAGGGNVLLVGEAEGLLGARLSGELGARVTWFEPSPSNVERRGEGGRIPALAGDPCDLPFATGEFDAVASQFALGRVPEPGSAVREWARVTGAGGLLVVVCRNELFGGWEPRIRPRGCAGFTPARLRGILEGCGLEVRETSTLLPDLRFPRLYRGDLSFCLKVERLPWFRDRGMLLFASARKKTGVSGVRDQGRA